MKPCSRLLGLSLTLLLVVNTLLGKPPNPVSKGHQLYREAGLLHKNKKYDEAAARMKAATGLEPANPVFTAYRAELEKLAKEERFDAHALKASPGVEDTVDHLAAYLVKPARNDREKARLLWRWITHRIAYDFDSFVARRPPDSHVETTLRSRKALCGGYAELFEQLAKRVGLEAVQIRGVSKDFVGTGRHENHVWNAVKLDGRWQLIDCCWGAASMTGHSNHQKVYQDYYFLPPPENLIYTHFPDEARWQLINPVIAREEFLSWPRVPHQLFLYGIKVPDLRAKLKPGPLVFCYDIPNIRVTVHAAPLEAKLTAGNAYRFCLESAGFEDMWVFMDGASVPLKKAGTRFEGTVQAKKGHLRLSARTPNESTRFDRLFSYMVE